MNEKNNKVEEKTVDLSGIPRKQMIKVLESLKIKTNMELNLLDKDVENFEVKQQELLGTLREIELRLFNTRQNKNESKFYKFTPSSVISGNLFNRSQRRLMVK